MVCVSNASSGFGIDKPWTEAADNSSVSCLLALGSQLLALRESRIGIHHSSGRQRLCQTFAVQPSEVCGQAAGCHNSAVAFATLCGHCRTAQVRELLGAWRSIYTGRSTAPNPAEAMPDIIRNLIIVQSGPLCGQPLILQ